MLMTAGKQPGLISCDWAERSPGFSYWWIQILHMLIIHGSNIFICRWFAQANASENCPIKSSLKAESTQLLSDVKQYLAKACKTTGTINIPIITTA